MNPKFRNYMMLAALLALMISVNCQAQEERGGGGGRLAGTWDAAVAITNCSTGDVITTFQSIASFHQGGTFTGITSGTPAARRSPEVGVWEHQGGNSYLFRFKAYLFNTADAPIGYQIVTHTVELDRDNLNYTSAGDAKIFNLAGTQIGAGCSSAVGTRMVLD